jgi:hypothetical protein
VGIASTHKGNLIVGARAFHGHPYDGHTLHEQLEQATIRMQDSAVEPATVFVDLGYRGVDAQQTGCAHRAPGQDPTDQQAGEQAAQATQNIEPIPSFAPVAAGQGWGDIAQARLDARKTGARVKISGATECTWLIT